MNVLLVYDSRSGNTEQIARAIAFRLERLGTVQVLASSDPSGIKLRGVDFLVVGGPTHGHGVSRPMRTWLDDLPDAALEGFTAAAFDTRFRIPALLSGSAARGIGKTLRRKGARLVAAPESFFVAGAEGPLQPGEIDRAGAWAETIATEAARTPTARESDRG